jgi:SAM-dependent methyltransferase
VVSCLSLIDIEDAAAAIAEMARVLKPGGTLLVANLTGFSSARARDGWQRDLLGRPIHFAHRPLSGGAVQFGKLARHQDRQLAPAAQRLHALVPGPGPDPDPFRRAHSHRGEPGKAARYNRVPWYVIMEWRKPA